jgi:hypothetical protein
VTISESVGDNGEGSAKKREDMLFATGNVPKVSEVREEDSRGGGGIDLGKFDKSINIYAGHARTLMVRVLTPNQALSLVVNPVNGR